MKFLKSLIKIISPPKKSRKKGGASPYRDYGREAMSKNHDIIKEVRLLCALDERTCLKCLELDGTKNPPKLPIHKGCRCITIPITKTWKELGAKYIPPKGSPFSDVGENRSNTAREIQKAYLIERARALENGLEGDVLANHLRTILPSLKSRYPEQKGMLAEIKAKVFAFKPNDDLEEIEDILKSLPWFSGAFGPLFKQCAELQAFNLIDKTLKVKSDKLCRVAGDSVKAVSLEKAVEYYEQAQKIDKKNTAIMMELGKLYRRCKRFDEAKRMFKQVLKIKPDHKGAKRELERL